MTRRSVNATAQMPVQHSSTYGLAASKNVIETPAILTGVPATPAIRRMPMAMRIPPTTRLALRIVRSARARGIERSTLHTTKAASTHV